MSNSCGSRSASRTESASAGSSSNKSSVVSGASSRSRPGASLPSSAGPGTATEPLNRASTSCALACRALRHAAECAPRRGKSAAHFRVAEGREGAAGDRCHRGARHRSGRRGAGRLAAHPQSPVRRGTAATLHQNPASGLAAQAEPELMTGRSATLVIMVAAVVVTATTMGPNAAPRLIWNASDSVPTGLYHVQPALQLNSTTLVVAYPPEPLATYLADSGYLPRGVPLIKHVLALPGQTVCRTGLTITVDEIDVGAARERDRRGRSLPVWQGCRVVAAGEVFLMNRDEPASLDGR